jgi:pimeloyl-ACP methyl ester carboxylesterase
VVDVRLLEYPGYGPRPGAPGERSLVAATLAATAALRAEGKATVLVAGESLGSGVAALAAAQAPARLDGLLLVTPLASVPAVAARHYGFVPGFLVRDAYRADRALASYRGPVAFLVAGRDEVVFTDLGRALHDAHAGPKRLWTDPEAGHNTVDWDPRLRRWQEMLEFLTGR